jgi:hypothetical protein
VGPLVGTWQRSSTAVGRRPEKRLMVDLRPVPDRLTIADDQIHPARHQPESAFGRPQSKIAATQPAVYAGHPAFVGRFGRPRCPTHRGGLLPINNAVSWSRPQSVLVRKPEFPSTHPQQSCGAPGIAASSAATVKAGSTNASSTGFSCDRASSATRLLWGGFWGAGVPGALPAAAGCSRLAMRFRGPAHNVWPVGKPEFPSTHPQQSCGAPGRSC